jgi:hypothetical protein
MTRFVEPIIDFLSPVKERLAESFSDRVLKILIDVASVVEAPTGSRPRTA